MAPPCSMCRPWLVVGGGVFGSLCDGAERV